MVHICVIRKKKSIPTQNRNRQVGLEINQDKTMLMITNRKKLMSRTEVICKIFDLSTLITNTTEGTEEII